MSPTIPFRPPLSLACPIYFPPSTTRTTHLLPLSYLILPTPSIISSLTPSICPLFFCTIFLSSSLLIHTSVLSSYSITVSSLLIPHPSILSSFTLSLYLPDPPILSSLTPCLCSLSTFSIPLSCLPSYHIPLSSFLLPQSFYSLFSYPFPLASFFILSLCPLLLPYPSMFLPLILSLCPLTPSLAVMVPLCVCMYVILQTFTAPSFDDKILEVVAVFGSMQMAVSRVINLQHHRIAQVTHTHVNIYV